MSADGPTELWNEIEAGQWSVVDEQDHAIGRYVLAHTSGARALTRRERQVVEHASRGLSNKAIAYELGVSTSTVSTHLSCAAAKLGVQSRGAVICIFVALSSDKPGVSVSYYDAAGRRFAVLSMPAGSAVPDVLSPAEREVVELAFAGKSNAAIAHTRGVSTRTVENQIAAAMRKLNVTSRANLTAYLMSGVTGTSR